MSEKTFIHSKSQVRWAGIIFDGDKYAIQHRLKKSSGLITRSGIPVVMMWLARMETGVG